MTTSFPWPALTAPAVGMAGVWFRAPAAYLKTFFSGPPRGAAPPRCGRRAGVIALFGGPSPGVADVLDYSFLLSV
jgi:hypothetical protein